jgi:HEAT repeat protein
MWRKDLVMVMTTQVLARMLRSDEPDYRALARHGAQLLPQLRALIAGRDEDVAAGAASLAGFIGDERAIDVLRIGAQSRYTGVRVAVAAALRTLRRPAASELLMRLLDDGDLGVRKFAIKSSVNHGDPRLQTKVAQLGARDPSPALRQVAMAALSGRRGPNGGGNGSRIA